MNRCSNKAFFVTLSHSMSSIFGKDEYVYPLNKETVLKSKNEWAQIRNANLNHKFVQHHEECKFIRSDHDDAIDLFFQPVLLAKDDEIISKYDPFDKEIISMIVEDNSLFEIVENLLINNNNDLTTSSSFLNAHHSQFLGSFYRSLSLNVPQFKNIPFRKLFPHKKNKGTYELLLLSINKYGPSVDEIYKYVPKYLIPTQNDVEKVIKKSNLDRNYDFLVAMAMCDINMRLCDLVFNTIKHKFVFTTRDNIKKDFFKHLRCKSWKCFIGSGITSFKYDTDPDYTLERNPCLVIFFPKKYHTEERYLNALKNDIDCYKYLNKKFITPNIDTYYNMYQHYNVQN